MKKREDSLKSSWSNNQSEQDKTKNPLRKGIKEVLEKVGEKVVGINILQNNRGSAVYGNPGANDGASVDECEIQWKEILKDNDFKKLEKTWEERAQERAERKRSVERSNAIQNAYFTMGGIYNQLDRLSENFEMAEATGQALSIGVVYTILLELDHDLKKLAEKIEKMEQLGEAKPAFSRQEQQILELEKSIRQRMSELFSLPQLELNRLEADMDELSHELEEQKSQEWHLPDFPEEQQSEDLWKMLQELIKEVNIEALGNDVESEENQARIRRQAETVRQLSETQILPRWNKYPEQPPVMQVNQTISEASPKSPDKTEEIPEAPLENAEKLTEATDDFLEN